MPKGGPPARVYRAGRPMLNLPVERSLGRRATFIRGSGFRRTGEDSRESITQKQVALAAPYIDQGPPSGIPRRERLSHDQAESSVANLAARNLRRDSEKLLIGETLRIKITR